MPDFSDYIVYVDESGDHGLSSINRDYPIFVLSFCIFRKAAYATTAVPALLDFKFRHFGHDMVVLHERDIRKQQGDFGFLRNRDARNLFLSDLSNFVAEADFTIIAMTIDKHRLIDRYIYPQNPYEIALKFGLERLYGLLSEEGEQVRETTLVFEGRGNRENRDLELEFRRVCDGQNYQGVHFPFKIKIASKQANSCGLQLADLTARPIGQHCLNPNNRNRAYATLAPKLYQKNGNVSGWGLKVFP
jgi:hypothetical protein